MKALKTIMTGAAAAAALSFAAAPAQAQYYDDYYHRDRDNTGRVIAGVAAAVGAVAVATAAAQGRYGYDPRYGYGHDRGFERHAVHACQYEAQRRFDRYGRVRVDIRDVQHLRNGRIRVLGAAEMGRYDRGWDRRWDNRYQADRRAFTCEVNRNGRVSSFRTHNYRW